MRGRVRQHQGQKGIGSDWKGGGRDVKPSCVALQTKVQMQEVMAKSGTLIVMQNVNPAERWVQGALCDDCLVGFNHTVLVPIDILEISKQDHC